jgi:hypothetical protein
LKSVTMGLAILGTVSSFTGAPANSPPGVALVSDVYTSPRSTIGSLSNVSNPAFRAFISRVLDNLQPKVGPHKIVPTKDIGPNTSSLHFVRIAVASSGDQVWSDGGVPAVSAEDGCVIQSPWIEVTVSVTPKPRVTGTVFWNERQVLQDQAILGDLTQVTSAPRHALPRSLFEQLAKQYADNEILRMPVEQGAAQSAERVPPDVLWLFRHSPQSTRGPFSAGAEGAMQEIAQRAAGFYAELAATLVNRCLDAPRARYTYAGIGDVSGIIPLSGYDLK